MASSLCKFEECGTMGTLTQREGSAITTTILPPVPVPIRFAARWVSHRAGGSFATGMCAMQELRDTVVEAWCWVIRKDTCWKQNVTIIMNMIDEFGSEKVCEWLKLTSNKCFSERRSIKYICGIARNERGASNA